MTYPKGSYAWMLQSQTRGAWAFRNAAELAVYIPDADPEKKLMTQYVNDTLAAIEGNYGMAGSSYAGTEMYNWAATQNPRYVGGYVTGLGVSPLGFVDSEPAFSANAATCLPASNQTGSDGYGSILGCEYDTWMQNYYLYGVGRTLDMGFQSLAELNYAGQAPIGIINNTGGNGFLGSTYQAPTRDYTNQLPITAPWYATWSAWLSAFGSNYLLPNTTTSPPTAYGDWYEKLAGGSEEYAAAVGGALAYLVQYSVTGATAAYAWYNDPTAGVGGNSEYMYTNCAGGNNCFPLDPRYAIIPRTDNNAMPAIPTTPQ